MNRIDLVTGAICVAMLAMSCSNQAAKTLTTEEGSIRTIEAYGQAEIEVVPDIAKIGIEVRVEGSGAREVQEATAAKVEAVKAYLAKKGVKAGDIETGRISVEPVHGHSEPGEKKVITYEGLSRLQITTKDVDKAEDLRLDVLEAGYSAPPVVYSSDKIAEYQQKVNVMAIEAAMENATAMALVVDAKPGEIIKITSQFTGVPLWTPVQPAEPEGSDSLAVPVNPEDAPKPDSLTKDPSDGVPGASHCIGHKCPKTKHKWPGFPAHADSSVSEVSGFFPGTTTVHGLVGVQISLVE